MKSTSLRHTDSEIYAASFFSLKDIGQTVGGHKGPADSITLASQKFEIGDFMDIAIMLPRENRRIY